LNRQIEEATYNIKPQDYNEHGELKEEAIPVDAEIIGHNFPENNSGSKKARGVEATPESFFIVESKSP
jgi:hypothetical protein